MPAARTAAVRMMYLQDSEAYVVAELGEVLSLESYRKQVEKMPASPICSLLKVERMRRFLKRICTIAYNRRIAEVDVDQCIEHYSGSLMTSVSGIQEIEEFAQQCEVLVKTARSWKGFRADDVLTRLV